MAGRTLLDAGVVGQPQVNVADLGHSFVQLLEQLGKPNPGVTELRRSVTSVQSELAKVVKALAPIRDGLDAVRRTVEDAPTASVDTSGLEGEVAALRSELQGVRAGYASLGEAVGKIGKQVAALKAQKPLQMPPSVKAEIDAVQRSVDDLREQFERPYEVQLQHVNRNRRNQIEGIVARRRPVS